MAVDCLLVRHCAAVCPDFLQESQTIGARCTLVGPGPADRAGRGGLREGAGRGNASAAQSGAEEYSAPLGSLFLFLIPRLFFQI